MSRLLAKLIEQTGEQPAPNSKVAFALWNKGVSDSDELQRILNLPRRKLDLTNVPDLTPLFRKPGGTMRLWPIQSAALLEMERCGGLFAPIGVGHGKCLGKGTPVLMFDGSVKSVEDVCVGERLMGPDSKPRTVLSTARGVGPLYRVDPVKGDSWVCNDAHILTLVHSTTGEIFDISVNNYLNKCKKFRDESKLFTLGVDFLPSSPLPLDPYFLGVWFGDGTKNLRGVSISKPDPEIKDLVDRIASDFNLKVRVSGPSNSPTFHLAHVKGSRNNILLTLLRNLVGPEVKIPKEYLTGSKHDRAEFLAGLLDTDGSLNSGCYDFVQKRKDYVDAVCFLARSLGLRANTSKEKLINGVSYWRTCIYGDTSLIPCRLPRKRANPRKQKKDARRTGFKLIPLGNGEYFGFTLTGDGRFLLGDFTVTHNTLISLLAPVALESKQTVLLVPPQLRDQLLRKDIPELEKHFEIPMDRVRVVAYSTLSSPLHSEIIDRIKPDLIVADEAHNLRHKSSTRTKRFVRYFRNNPHCRFVGLSGTMTTRSIKDYSHLAELALREQSPVPIPYNVLDEWSAALDVSDFPMPAGALTKLCEGDEDVRHGFRRRLVDSYGVVSTSEGAIGTSLIINIKKPAVPKKVQEELDKLRKLWVIGEEEIEDAMALARVARQISCGFYYKWDWPDGVVDTEWLAARSNWFRELRSLLLHRSKPGLDSPLLVTNAAREGRIETSYYQDWSLVKDRPQPPTIPVWLDEFLIDETVKWAKDSKEGIIWYLHDAVGQKLAERGLPVFGAGSDKELLAANPQKKPVIACSVMAHGTGKNLQAWSRNLVTSAMANGQIWEQLLGRCHRPGQLEDEVNVDVFLHTEELEVAFNKSCDDAEYIEATQSNRQKLNFARILRCDTIV